MPAIPAIRPRPTSIPRFRTILCRWNISRRDRSCSRPPICEAMALINKQLNILDFTIVSLRRRAGKICALLAVYLMVVFLLASVMFFVYAVKRETASLLADAPEIVVQRLVAGRHDPIPLAYQEKIRDIRG